MTAFDRQMIQKFLNGGVIAVFTGRDSKISASDWISLYEMRSKGVVDEMRIQTLMTYLTNDALNWFASEVAKEPELSWSEVKRKFLARYGTSIAAPGVTAFHRRMTFADSMQSYAQEKMALLRDAEVPMKTAIPLLTEGIPI